MPGFSQMSLEERSQWLARLGPHSRQGVVIYRFKPPVMDDFEEEMIDRTLLLEALKSTHAWVYINPIAIVASEQPTAAFLTEVNCRQAEWHRRAMKIFPRAILKTVKDWVSHRFNQSKAEKYLCRSLCVPGMVLHNGNPIPNHTFRRIEMSKRQSGSAETSLRREDGNPPSIPIPPRPWQSGPDASLQLSFLVKTPDDARRLLSAIAAFAMAGGRLSDILDDLSERLDGTDVLDLASIAELNDLCVQLSEESEQETLESDAAQLRLMSNALRHAFVRFGAEQRREMIPIPEIGEVPMIPIPPVPVGA